MNDLYLIGNGFDLAHGLKTSYNDFLLWYLKESIGKAELYTIEDDLLKIDGQNSSFVPSGSPTIPLLLEHSSRSGMKIKYKHDFFKKIVDNYRDYKWVDIEYEYYMALVDLYKGLDSGKLIKESIIVQLMELNKCFDSIKKKLVEYLAGLEISQKIVHKQIEQILRENEEGEKQSASENSYKLFVNFNYTSTIKLYDNDLIYKDKLEVVNIHGKLNDEDNPEIFGYGDEMDPHYDKIENLNNNNFLKNIKSFGYLRTNNYQRVNSFIEGDGKGFTVKVLGHSCGLSDRILLNTIFEHPNCQAIKIYYYQKSETENDYFEKTQEISRHFRASMKGKMREKIIPFEKSIPMPQNPKEN